jgi:signal peptidase I
MNTPKTDRANLPPAWAAAMELWSQEGKHHWIPVSGHSMVPVLREGDRILVSHQCAQIRAGDIIVFWQNGRLLIHRAVRLSGTLPDRVFLTKGDNTQHFDSPVNARDVIGRVIAIERGDRRFSIDTTAWRILNRLVALIVVVETWLLDHGADAKRKLLGNKPNRFTAFLRQSITAPVALVLRILTTLLDRENA